MRSSIHYFLPPEFCVSLEQYNKGNFYRLWSFFNGCVIQKQEGMLSALENPRYGNKELLPSNWFVYPA